MGIDRISSPTTPPNINATQEALETSGAQPVETASVQGKSLDSVASTDTLLARLERGEVSREQYLDFRVSEAVTPFAGKLSPDQLESLQTALREQLEIDPMLIELCRRATAVVPSK